MTVEEKEEQDQQEQDEQEQQDEKDQAIEDAKSKEPEIGMTSDEVRASLWGEPEDVNTTETADGTSEQWCYSDSRYVYLDNGVVTSIQK
jgi:hypothetical protein